VHFVGLFFVFITLCHIPKHCCFYIDGCENQNPHNYKYLCGQRKHLSQKVCYVSRAMEFIIMDVISMR